jgi:hypothetical protein
MIRCSRLSETLLEQVGKQGPREAIIEIDLNEDPADNRMLAEYLVETYTHGMRQVMETIASASRWVTTSLLAINGGAAIAILNHPMATNGKLLSTSLFAAGVLSALASAQSGIRAGNRLMGPMGDALGYWITVKHDGHRVADLEGHEVRLAALVKKAARVPAFLGYLSVALFTAGLISAALSMAGSL